MSPIHPHRATGVGEHHLARLAEQAYERRGDYPSLLYEGAWLRSGEIFQRAAGLGGGFASLGLKPGERVVVTMANCPEVSIVYQALWRAGLVVTPATFLLPALGAAPRDRRFAGQRGRDHPGVLAEGDRGRRGRAERALRALHRGLRVRRAGA